MFLHILSGYFITVFWPPYFCRPIRLLFLNMVWVHYRWNKDKDIKAPLRGVEWFCRQILREVTTTVVERAKMSEGVGEWKDWGAEEVQKQVRSSTEEGRLWKILE